MALELSLVTTVGVVLDEADRGSLCRQALLRLPVDIVLHASLPNSGSWGTRSEDTEGLQGIEELEGGLLRAGGGGACAEALSTAGASSMPWDCCGAGSCMGGPGGAGWVRMRENVDTREPVCDGVGG